MASAGTVTLELDANSVKMIRELQKAQNQTRKSTGSMQQNFSRAFTDIRKNAVKTTKIIAGIATAVAAAGAAIFRAQSTMLDELAKTSDALGIQQERLQALQLIADLTGASASQLSTNLERMQRNIGRVAREGGPASKALDDIGLNIQDIINLKPDEQLEVFARALGEVENQAVKASIAQDLFGRDGVRMLKLMEQLNRDGLQPVVDQLQELGIAMTRIDTAKVEAARDELQKAREVSQTTARQFTVGISTAVASLSRMFTESRRGAESIADAVEEISVKVITGTIRMGASAAESLLPVKRAAEEIWAAFMGLPTWAKEIGIMGALMFGPKGVAAVALVSKAMDDTKVTAEWWRAYRENEISFFEWFTTGSEAARQRLQELERDVTTFGRDPLGGGTDFSILDSLFGGSEESDFAERGERLIAAFRKTFDDIRREIQESATSDGVTAADLIFGDESSALSGLSNIIRQTRTQMEVLADQIRLVEQAIEQGITAPFEEAGTTGEEVLSRLMEQMRQLEDQSKEMSEFSRQAARNMQDGFARFLFDPFDQGLKGMLRGFLNTIRQMAAQAASASILRAVFSGMSGSTNPFLSGLGAAFSAPSFDGGGYTGSGSRTGGIDGRGGFPAIIHPNEQVIDMTRESTGPINVNIYANDTKGFDELIQSRRGLITSIVTQSINNRGRVI